MNLLRCLQRILFFLLCLWLGLGAGIIESKSTTSLAQTDPMLRSTAFVENVGQWDARSKFQAQTNLGTLFLTEREWWWTIIAPSTTDTPTELFSAGEITNAQSYRAVNLRVRFVGSNPNASISPLNRTATSINYLQGSEPAKWHTNVPVWQGVRYENLYPGIDLEIVTEQGVAPPRFIMREATLDYLSSIQVQIDGAEVVGLNEAGITLETAIGTYPFPLFEVVDADGMPVPTPSPSLVDNTLIHPFGHSHSVARTMDAPQNALPSNLIYSTYIGGTEGDEATGVDVDEYGAMYITGDTSSPDFPTTPGAYDPTSTVGFGFTDIFISKLSPDGQALVYSTYISGNDSDHARALKIGQDGSTYVTGNTRSDDFPTTPNTPGGFRGSNSAFILRLNPTGSSLIYSAVLGGDIPTGNTDPGAVAVDLALADDGSATIVGSTDATDFPVTAGAYDTYFDPADFANAFVTRISPYGNTLLFSTFLGGIGDEDHTSVDIDDEGNTYVFGSTSSPDFPTTPGAFDREFDFYSYFVTKFNPDGSDLVYSTYYGAAPSRGTPRIRVGADHSAYAISAMAGGTVPITPGAYDPQCGYQGQGCNFNDHDVFAFRLNPEGSDLIYSTYLGGSANDSTGDLLIDEAGNAYILAFMESPEFPYTPGAYRDIMPGLLILNSSGSDLLYSGSTPGIGSLFRFTLQSPRVLVLAGSAGDLSNYTVTPDAYQPTITGYIDATLARMVLPAIATEQLIPSTGGQLTSTIDQTTYIFAANTFTTTVLFTHAPRHPLSLPSFAPLIPIGHTFANTAVLSGTTTIVHPQQPYQLNITYTDAEVGTLNENSLQLYRWNGTIWQPEPTAVLHPATNTITATPDDTGWWAVLAQPHQFYLSSIRR